MRGMIDRMAPWTMAAALIALPAVALSQGAGKSVWSGIYTQAQAERGAAAYAQYCASCHGEALSGGDSAPPLAGPAFMANWTGQTADALFTRMKTTMPLDNPDSLPAATVADIEAFMLSHNEFPAGETELPSDPALQAGIAITADRPAQ